jgi:hypothetical protein
VSAAIPFTNSFENPQHPHTSSYERIHYSPSWNAVLEVLDMVDSLPVPSNTPTSDVNFVTFARLRTLRLRSTKEANEVVNVLALIVIPPTVTVEINCYRISPEAASYFASLLSRCFSNGPGFERYRSLKLVSLCDYLTLECWKEVKYYDYDYGDTRDIRLRLPLPNIPDRKPLEALFPSLRPLFDLTTLILVSNIPENTLVNPFGTFPKLLSVGVEYHRPNEFIKALRYKPEKYNTAASAYYSAPFPALQFLWVRNAKWPDYVNDFEELLDCLMERYEHNFELKKLRFAGCALVEEEVGLLKEIVLDVELV